MDKLQKYNNKLLKFGNSIIKFNPPIYNVTILPSEHGSISATPVSGYSGTTITLSNTPDTNYIFDSYSITGANIYDNNKFDIYKSDVSVQGNFKDNMNLLYEMTTEHTTGFNNEQTIDVSSYQYLVLEFQYRRSGSGASGIQSFFNNWNSNSLRTRDHSSYIGHAAIIETATNISTTIVGSNISNRTVDGAMVYYRSDLSDTTYQQYHQLINLASTQMKAYMNRVHAVTVNYNRSAYTTFKGFNTWKESSQYPYVKNYRVLGFQTEQRAIDYIINGV